MQRPQQQPVQRQQPRPQAAPIKSKEDEELEKSLKEDANLPSYLNVDTDEKIKKEVEKLITVVLKEGLEKGLKLAKKKSAFVEDAFHDALTEKLLPELEKRGII